MLSANFHAKPFQTRLYHRLGWALLTLWASASAAQARPFAYVANNDSDTVSVVDLATRVVTRTIAVGNGPTAVAITPDGRFVYVINTFSPRGIQVISTETNTVVNTISGLIDPTDLVFSPDGRLAYVTNNEVSGTVAVIDTATRVVTRNVTVGRNPKAIVVSPDGSYLYVVNTGTTPDTVSVIRTADNQVVNTITVGRDAVGAAISRDGRRLYVVNNDDDSISVIDASNGIGNGVIRTFNVINSPSWAAIGPDGTRLYVVSTLEDVVVEIDTATGATLGSPIQTGSSPNRVVLSPNGAQLYTTTLTGTPDSLVEVTLEGRAVKNIPVGNDPMGIAVTPLEADLATTSAASFSAGPLASEGIGAIFGSNLSGSVQVAATLPLPTALGGTVVKVKDSTGTERLAPLFFVAPGQVNYQVPAGTAAGESTITVSHTYGFVSSGRKQIARVAPGLFTANATGQGVVTATVLRVKADGAQIYELVANFDPAQGKFVPLPIAVGPESDQLFLIVFGSGMRFRSSLSATSATIGGLNAEVLYVGPQGDFVGLDQVNLRLPRALAGRGEVNVNLQVDGQAANAVLINVR